MDYLDPKKEVEQRILIMIGYILTAVAITLASLVLLYQSYGFDLGKNGTVIQNSLTFFSSKPNPASIYLNGKLHKDTTNTRIQLPEGDYQVKITRDGYHAWERLVHVAGGDIQRYDYPFLIPTTLEPKKVDSLPSTLSFASQSLDRRWFVANDGVSALTFKVYDLNNNPLKPAEPITLPATLLTDQGASNSWQLVEWADNNNHLLVRHIYETNKVEYVLIDRSKPEESINLTKQLSLGAGELTLKNRKHDQYYLYDPATKSLQTAALKDALRPVLLNVLAFKSYGDDIILYATDNGRPGGEVQINMTEGKKTHLLKTVDPDSKYLLDLASYSGSLYAVLGLSDQGKLYIYKDPIGQLTADSKPSLVPTQVLRIQKPDRLSFSATAQFIVAQSGQNFSVYDIQAKNVFNYASKFPIDAPQKYATWMDGNRLTYVSGGKQIIFDYDNANPQTLSASLPAYLPMFDDAFDSVYNLTASATDPKVIELNRTSLLSKADQ
jgi:hypothetical protein